MKRTIVLLVSLAAGLAAAVLTYVYLAAKDAEIQVSDEDVTAACAGS